MNRVLMLTLRQEWFNAILYNGKRQEYREIKDYWLRRLLVSREEMEGHLVPELIYELTRASAIAVQWHLHDYSAEFARYDTLHVFNGGHFGSWLPNYRISIQEIMIGRGREDWGAPTDRNVFILDLAGEPFDLQHIMP